MSLRHAMEAREAGYVLVILRPGEKSPQRKGWIEEEPDEALLSFSIRHGSGFGIKTVPPLVVLDEDGPCDLKLETPMAVRTRKGVHRYARLPEGIHDVRTRIRVLTNLDALAGSNRYAVGPGTSIVRPEPWRYELVGRIVPVAELPECPPEIVAELTRPVIETRGSIARAFHHSQRFVRDPVRYCMTIFSREGENGSGALIRCLAVWRDCGKSATECWAFLERWNRSNCTPPWSDAELTRALRRVYGIE